jgi:hypothetical protein
VADAARPPVRVAASTSAADSDTAAKSSLGAGWEQSARPAKTAVNEGKVAEKPAVSKKPVRVAAARDEPRLVPVTPRQPRVRVTQYYAPPSYVGRVVVHYAPQPSVFVPSSGSFRRAPFRGDSMWEAVRRNGL